VARRLWVSLRWNDHLHRDDVRAHNESKKPVTLNASVSSMAGANRS
jgi:hypothetical protein